MPGLYDLDWIAIAASTLVAAAWCAAGSSPARSLSARRLTRDRQTDAPGRAGPIIVRGTFSRYVAPIRVALSSERMRRPKLALSLLVATVGLACSQQDIPGTYEVELLVDGARAPIEATMILTTSYFEMPSRGYDAMPDRDETSGEPNSCLILPSTDPSDPAPRSVSLFESRIRGGEFLSPVTLFDTGEQRMEITELSFFAGAAGGTLAFHDEQGTREGRIIGTRVGGPDGMRCSAELAKFLAKIDQLLESQ